MTADKPEGARLRECPFCGGANIYCAKRSNSDGYQQNDSYTVCGCIDCNVSISISPAKWNTRHEPSILAWAEQNPEAVKALLSGEAAVVPNKNMFGLLYMDAARSLGLSEVRLDKPIEESKPT